LKRETLSLLVGTLCERFHVVEPLAETLSLKRQTLSLFVGTL
jgi:hypothetical protein